ncbi:MAG TPA: hypothetical protein VGJ84_13040, partial [Polyangiaceae bacterium]
MSYLQVSLSAPKPVSRAKRLRDYQWLGAVPFALMHLAPLCAIWTGTKWQDWAACLVLYWGRMFFVSAAYHRYFSHRTY